MEDGALSTLTMMPDLMGMKQVMVINEEAHHCYREKPREADADPEDNLEGETVDDLKGEDKEEAKKNNEAAQVWISGIEAVNRKLGVARVVDLSATPFFLSGSGYAEGTLFPWTMSDFSLMDAIECGIVKLPRVPVADNLAGNVSGDDMPKFRNLWEHIRKKMPKKGRGKAASLDPLSLPVELQTALEALDTYWIPGVNNDGRFGRWASAEFTEVYKIETDFAANVRERFNEMVAEAVRGR